MEAAQVGLEEEVLMPHKMLRVLAVLVLVTLTATGAAQAAGRTFSHDETSGFAATWDWVAGWLRSVPVLSGMLGKEGSQMDPNGGPIKAGSSTDINSPTPDEGSSMDPNGLK
jgi:hypothetical protein